VEIYKEFTFEAAHHLPKMPPDHKCRRLHGHSYRLRIYVKGDVGPSGVVVDFDVIKQAMAPLLYRLDHRLLNDVIPNPTSENLARWIWGEIELPMLSRVQVSETCTSSCMYSGEDDD
jgi:6-pyruvoyltetrahydropterin/6-carboxytetrahydropterin synthase